jgi:hypothetical protein
MADVEGGVLEPSTTAWWQSNDEKWHPPADCLSYGLTGYADSPDERTHDHILQVQGFVTILLGVLTISGLLDAKAKSVAYAIVASAFFLAFVVTAHRGRRLKRREGRPLPEK